MSRSQKTFLSSAQAGFVALLLLVLPACQQAEEAIDIPAIAVRSADDRRGSLEALKSAWYSRPTQNSPQNERAERFFLNGLGSFVQRTKGREVYSDACRLWNVCVRDHSSRYRDVASNYGQP